MIARLQPVFCASMLLILTLVSSRLDAQWPSQVHGHQVPENSLRTTVPIGSPAAGAGSILVVPYNPNPPHLVLEVPQPRPQTSQRVYSEHGQWQGEQHSVAVEHNAPQPDATQSAPVSAHHDKLKNRFLHADKQERAVAIPAANRQPVWKTPYSYGHFGASRNRQWSYHRGHHESYSQWTLR